MDNLLGIYEGASSASADRDEAKKLDVIAVSALVHARIFQSALLHARRLLGNRHGRLELSSRPCAGMTARPLEQSAAQPVLPCS